MSDLVTGPGTLRRIVAVEPLDGFRLRLTFDGGEVRRYDAHALLDLPVFRPLRDPAYFRRVFVAFGTVQWPDDQDLCPDSLYEASMPEAMVSDTPEPAKAAPAMPDGGMGGMDF